MRNLIPDTARSSFPTDRSRQPGGPTRISHQFAMEKHDGLTTYFHNLVPFDSHPTDDVRSRRLRIAKLHELNRISQTDLARAFDMNRVSLARIVKLYKDGGEDACLKPQSPRSRTVFDEDRTRRVEEMLDKGISGPTIARELGVSVPTFYENRRSGVFGKKNILLSKKRLKSVGTQIWGVGPEESLGAGRSVDRDAEDRLPPRGRAARDVPDLPTTAPSFHSPYHAVAHGGVLTALPMLLEEGLLSHVTRKLPLPGEFYGTTSILLLLAFLLLTRVRNPKQLCDQSLRDWESLLGLEHCPEVKTLREMMKCFTGEDERVSKWQRELSDQWIRPSEEAALTLVVDGQAKVYDGKGNKPKNHVGRQMLCLPATVGYWVDQLNGAPVMCLHQELSPEMTALLKDQVIPELRTLGVIGEDAPDLTQPDAGEPAVTLVFDREGWSPSLFHSLARCGVAVITWYKHSRTKELVDWEEDRFAPVEVTIQGPAEGTRQTMQLAEGTVRLKTGLEVRQIRRLLDPGTGRHNQANEGMKENRSRSRPAPERQVPLMTTHPRMSMTDLASAMFSCWRQDNFIRHLRQEFPLDLYLAQDLVEMDPDADVVNPAWQELLKDLGRIQARFSFVKHRARRNTDNAAEVALMKDVKDVEDELRNIRSLKQQISPYVKVGELENPLHSLTISERLFIGIIRMIGYRAETRMMGPLLESQGEGRKAHDLRELLKGLLTSSANLIPEPDRGVLRVQVPGLGDDAEGRTLEPLFRALNETETVYPGTHLRMVYEAC